MVLLCRPVGRGGWHLITVHVPNTMAMQLDLFEKAGDKPKMKKREHRKFNFFGRELRVVEVRP